MVRIAVDDAPIHGSHHIDLVRNQLEGQLRRVVDKLSLDDVYGINAINGSGNPMDERNMIIAIVA